MATPHHAQPRPCSPARAGAGRHGRVCASAAPRGCLAGRFCDDDFHRQMASLPGEGRPWLHAGASTPLPSPAGAALGGPRGSNPCQCLLCRAVRALCDHAGTADGHLSFQKGDVLQLLSTVDEDWIHCCHGNRTGLVPVGYTSLIV